MKNNPLSRFEWELENALIFRSYLQERLKEKAEKLASTSEFDKLFKTQTFKTRIEAVNTSIKFIRRNEDLIDELLDAINYPLAPWQNLLDNTLESE